MIITYIIVLRTSIVSLLLEVYSQVVNEPELQPVSQEEFSLSAASVQDGARLDIVTSFFQGECQSVPLLMSIFFIKSCQFLVY